MMICFVVTMFGGRTTQIYCDHGNYGLLTGYVQKMVDGEWTRVEVFEQRLNPGDGFLMFSTMNAEKEQPTVNPDGTLNVPEWCEKYITRLVV